MNLNYSIGMMFVFSFVIQYLIMSYIMTNSYKDVVSSKGKLYASLIMALFMCLVEILMHDLYTQSFSKNYYIVFIILLTLIIIFYRKQVFINDKDYLNGMIEHHSMALLTSNKALSKTKDGTVSQLASNIIKTQEQEIDVMKKKVKDL
jgi:hypothetical protein